jgi:Flp pilus assembly protein TadD
MWLLIPFVLGLLSKPMLVTLPLVLLLLDYWPLGRIVVLRERPWLALAEEGSRSPNPAVPFKTAWPLLVEKIPLLALSAAASLMAWHSQFQVNALVSLESLAVDTRLVNALLSYVTYIQKMVWPHGLAVHYPHGGALAPWKTIGAALLLMLVTVAVVRWRSEKPYFLVGWLWYLGTLVPVIGLIQAGSQSMADRYAYIPVMGLFLMIVWGLADIVAPYRHGKTILAVAAMAALATLAGVSHAQLNHWRNSVTLFEQAIRVTRDNAKAHNNLGVALAVRGRLKEAEGHYRKALLVTPEFVDAHNNLGNALSEQGRHEEAMVEFQAALALNPRYAKAHNNLGLSLARQGRVGEAMGHFEKALRLDPMAVDAMNNLGRVFQGLGDPDRAIEQYRKALALSPKHPTVWTNLGTCLFQKGSLPEAEETFRHAIRLDPRLASAYNALATLYTMSGRFEEAVKTRRQALTIEPDNGAAHYHMAVECFFSGDPARAIWHCDRAIELGYDGVEGAFLEELRLLRKPETR